MLFVANGRLVIYEMTELVKIRMPLPDSNEKQPLLVVYQYALTYKSDVRRPSQPSRKI